jgi:hypothetical protein
MGKANHQALANLRRLKEDFIRYAPFNLKIKTKDGSIDPLTLNTAQLHIHRIIEEQKAKTGKVRVIILKGRQQGASTYTEGRLYWLVSLNRGKQAFILTHEQQATDNLFTMAQRYHEYSVLKPETGAANAKELNFSKLDSGYKVGTAGSKAVGRSGTIQYFHGSEVAFWPNAPEHFAGVMQCVPDAADTEVILESTANGVGGTFYDLWQSATRGEGDYIPIFVPWFWQSEYRRNDPEFVPDEKEQRLAKLHGLDHAQLAWRRAKIAELRSEALFNQEYPNTPEEAFIASGRNVFDRDIVLPALLNCWSPVKRMVYESKKWMEREDGELRVWFDPAPGKSYVIGADVAEGLAHGDYSSADVLELPDGIQVAQWHGHVAPDRFGEIIYWLAMRYNKAFVGVEVNNHGLTTVTKLRDMNYPSLYARRVLDDRGSDSKETKKVGWETTSKSKYKIIDLLAAELREKTHGLSCAETVREMMTYIVNEKGGYEAQLGCYDDRVMSRAIAGEMLRACPSYSGLR